MNVDLLKLPWELQVALAGGYAAYAIAYTGLRSRHQTVDVILITVVFSLAATATLAMLASLGLGPYWRAPAALAACLIAGVVWRRWLRPALPKMLRWANVSWAEDAPSAIATLSENSEYPVSQVAVLLDNGTWLQCNEAWKFADAPYGGPCIIGPTGDIALYLTHEESASGEVKELRTVRDSDYGDRITYIPASRIKRITIRHQKS